MVTTAIEFHQLTRQPRGEPTKVYSPMQPRDTLNVERHQLPRKNFWWQQIDDTLLHSSSAIIDSARRSSHTPRIISDLRNGKKIRRHRRCRREIDLSRSVEGRDDRRLSGIVLITSRRFRSRTT